MASMNSWRGASDIAEIFHYPPMSALLGPVDAAGLGDAAALLSRVFPGRRLFTTVYDGPRPSGLPAEIDADLTALAEALPPDCLSLDPALRDSAGQEPTMLRFLREAEGTPPAIYGVLTPPIEAAAAMCIDEARALGFTDETGPRPLGLLGPESVTVEDRTAGIVRLSASASWQDLLYTAQNMGLSAAPAFPDLFPTPALAAAAGTWRTTAMEEQFGRIWSVRLALPPSSVKAVERTWLFRSRALAEDALHNVSSRFAPALAMTIPAIDGALMAAARLWPRHRRLDGQDGTALRVVFYGSQLIRRVAMAEASWSIEKTGGVCLWRRPPPPTAMLEALAAASGVCRLSRPTDSEGALPPGAVVMPQFMSLYGKLTRQEVVWYPRDLSRSIQEARAVLGLPERGDVTPPTDLLDADPIDAAAAPKDGASEARHGG